MCWSKEDFEPTPHLTLLSEKIYENAVNHGFYPEGVQDREVPEKLMLMVSELSEALEEWRNNHGVNETYYNPEAPAKPEGVPIELADALIRILDFSRAYGIDMDEAVRIKMEYNKSRPFRHGGKKA